MNRFEFIGNLTKNPETEHYSDKSTGAITAITTLNIAVNKIFTNEEGRQEKTDYFRVKLKDKRADNAAKYLVKGSKVFVCGTIANTKWKDKKTGEDRYGYDFWANDIEYLNYVERPSHTPEKQNEAQPAAEAVQPAPVNDLDEDLDITF